MRNQSKQREQIALYTVASIALCNVIVFKYQDDWSKWDMAFKVEDGSYKEIMYSMFTHSDIDHLVSNIVAFVFISSRVFIYTSSSFWQSPIVILILYIGSGFGTCGCFFLMQIWHEYDWNRKLETSRKVLKNCDGILCHALRWTGDGVVEGAARIRTNVLHVDESFGQAVFKSMRRIGASGAIFGLYGAHLYLLFASPGHQSNLFLLDIVVCVGAFAVDWSKFSVDQKFSEIVVNRIVESDNVDHAGHIFGFVSGFLLAVLLDKFSKFKYGRRRRTMRGGGTRLGGDREQSRLL
mmetsp:Transcript_28989/g.44551  ORF Transcript_28989/g.44551 Transcript_28989/m.44551 type:complete len:294 (+) Transcript_28989:51-932(+)